MEQFGGLIIPITFFAVFYFIFIRPQQVRQKKLMEMRESLKVGDKIITIGGVVGKIVKVKDNEVVVEISEHTSIEFEKWAIGKVVEDKGRI